MVDQLPVYEGIHHAGRRIQDDKPKEKRKNSGVGAPKLQDASDRPGSQFVLQNAIVFSERICPSPSTRIHFPQEAGLTATNVAILSCE
jgi:hypothetical protein